MGQTSFNMTVYDFADKTTQEILKEKTGAEVPRLGVVHKLCLYSKGMTLKISFSTVFSDIYCARVLK